MQTRKGSFAESVISTSVGFLLSLIAQLIVFPLCGIEIKLSQNLQIVAIFTVISIARQYIFRRIFNNITVKRIMKHGKI